MKHLRRDESPLGGSGDLETATVNELFRQQGYEIGLLLDGEMKQEDLALNVMGYATQAAVSNIRNGKRGMSVVKAKTLDEAGYKTSLGTTFEAWVTAYKRARQGARESPALKVDEDKTYDVFLASPMVAVDGHYEEVRRNVSELADAIEKSCGFRVYCAAREIANVDLFDSADIAFVNNVRALSDSRHFVLYVQEILSKPSSVWVEAGMALALEIPSTYFASEPDALPYVLGSAMTSATVGGSAHTAVHFMKEPNQAVKLVRRNRARIFRMSNRTQKR